MSSNPAFSDEKAADKTVALVKELIALGRTTLGGVNISKEESKEQKAALAIIKVLLADFKVQQDGLKVDGHSSAKASFDEAMMALWFSLMF